MSQPTQKTPLVPRGSDHPDNLDRVRNQVDEIKVVMKDNINRAITRGEDLDELGDKSRQLEEDARVFGSRSQQVRRRFCVSYYRTIFVIAIIVIAIVALIIWWATS